MLNLSLNHELSYESFKLLSLDIYKKNTRKPGNVDIQRIGLLAMKLDIYKRSELGGDCYP